MLGVIASRRPFAAQSKEAEAISFCMKVSDCGEMASGLRLATA